MRSNIKCDADKCLHNSKGICDAAVVHVRNGNPGGESAKCTTYAYKVNNAGSRLLMEMGEDMSLDRKDKNEDVLIACGMNECCYNEDCACTADKIHILSPCECSGNQCGCATYKPQ